MKLVLCLVSLSAMLLLLPGVYLENGPIRCSWRDPLSAVELLKMAKTKAGKCFYECMLRSAGVVKEDALIDVQKFTNKVKATIPTLKQELLKIAVEVMEKCKSHKHENEDKCETTGLLLECSIEESMTRGWEPYRMVLMFKAIYSEGLRRSQLRYKGWD